MIEINDEHQIKNRFSFSIVYLSKYPKALLRFEDLFRDFGFVEIVRNQGIKIKNLP